MLLVHGRGASARDILTLVPELYQPNFAYLAPQAAQNTWYPNPFMAPMAGNEPWLSSALARLAGVLGRLGGSVTERLYPNLGHTTNEDELDVVRGLQAAL
jgi:phospholipase/carboxylesterase